MKKLLLTMLGVLMVLPAFARDFTYTYQGQTLTYTVISEEDKTVETKVEMYLYPEMMFQELLLFLLL